MSHNAQGPIGGATQLVGLIGWPVSHSVSPYMHNAAFAHHRLDWRYVPLPVNPDRPDNVREAVRGLVALGFRGANVTVPHKQAVMPHLDRLSPAARAIGAVNTIVVAADGMLTGENTDAGGFVGDLHAHGIESEGRRVLVLGAGGSARAVVYGLAQAGATTIAVANRTLATAQQLAAELQPHAGDCRLVAFALPADLPRLVQYADLIVNCTTLGMTPNVDASPWPDDLAFVQGQVVYDLVYNPSTTRLLRQAEAAGAQAIGGLGMLIWQGALAYERWTGQPAPVGVMRAAAEARFADQRQAAPAVPFVVRPATGADMRAIGLLNAQTQRLHADHVPNFFKQPHAGSFPPEYWQEILDRPNSVILVAEVDSEVVGYLYGDITPAMETNVTLEFARFYIHHISVTGLWQRHGIGAALIDAARREARKHKIGTLALTTWSFNERARRFFEQQGFVCYNYRMWMQGV